MAPNHAKHRIQVGINMSEAQSYVPNGILTKNKFHFIPRPMEPDTFLQILGEFQKCMDEMLKF